MLRVQAEDLKFGPILPVVLAGGADHNGIRFGPVLPRFIAGIISRTTKGKPYRIIVYSHREYRKILAKAKFGRLEFYWPYPGYQHPSAMIPMDNVFDIDYKQVTSVTTSGMKQLALSFLGRTGLLPYIVPHYSIVAMKN